MSRFTETTMWRVLTAKQEPEKQNLVQRARECANTQEALALLQVSGPNVYGVLNVLEAKHIRQEICLDRETVLYALDLIEKKIEVGILHDFFRKNWEKVMTTVS